MKFQENASILLSLDLFHEMSLFVTNRPIIDKEFCLDNIEEAHKYMESNSNIGKIVLYVKIYKVAFLSENDDDKDEL